MKNMKIVWMNFGSTAIPTGHLLFKLLCLVGSNTLYTCINANKFLAGQIDATSQHTIMTKMQCSDWSYFYWATTYGEEVNSWLYVAAETYTDTSLSQVAANLSGFQSPHSILSCAV